MQSLLAILSLGFILGMRHATDADHVVAISTITSKERSIRNSALVGILWGIGHSATVTLVGIPIILFTLKIPTRIGSLMEFSVGIMLVILGLINLVRFRMGKLAKFSQAHVHKHSHIHKGRDEHSHFHIHTANVLVDNWHHLGLLQTIRPLAIGLVHGLAGSAAIAILILATIHSKTLALIYLLIFHLGVVIGMMLITTFLGISFTVAVKRIKFLQKYLVGGSGLISLLFGAYIIYRIGIVGHLFTQ